jgi:hypothetical protein
MAVLAALAVFEKFLLGARRPNSSEAAFLMHWASWPMRMPINLRYDLRFRFDRTLANRLSAAWRQIERLDELAVQPAWWDAFHANRMKRSFVRHRFMYRIKARVHLSLRCHPFGCANRDYWRVALPR